MALTEVDVFLSTIIEFLAVHGTTFVTAMALKPSDLITSHLKLGSRRSDNMLICELDEMCHVGWITMVVISIKLFSSSSPRSINYVILLSCP